MNDAIDRIRAAIARADSASGLMEPIAVDDARAVIARLDALLDDFQDCDDCDGTGIGPIRVDGHGNVGDEPCSVCAGLGGIQKSAAQWITRWHERANGYRREVIAAATTLSQCQADLAAMTAERDDLIARHGDVAERMVLAESDLAAARGALETTRAVLLGALDRWNGPGPGAIVAGERLAESVRRVTDDLQSLTASGSEGE